VSTANAPKTPAALAALTLGALGVVYGDIGTSPLYALKEVFHGGHVATSSDNILGVLSLIFWTMTIIVSVKYVLLILRADNNGEGGLIAMLALATTAVKDKPALRNVACSAPPSSTVTVSSRRRSRCCRRWRAWRWRRRSCTPG